MIFIDLARALAVLFMLYGHVLDALLAPEYRTGRWFDLWSFQRGLTSSLFLLLAGFAFSIATTRHWATHLRLSAKVLHRLRRFAMYVLLGYALHLPASRLVEMRGASAEQWRLFLAVDVLQLIGVTFIGVQALVLVCRSRRVFTGAAFGLATVLVVAAPWLWSIPWIRYLPDWLAAYLSQAEGSLFPLIPWSAFVLLGAGLGQVYVRWGAARLTWFANIVLLLLGAALTGAALVLRTGWPAAFWSGPAAFLPPEVILRSGVTLLILGGFAHVSARMARLPYLFSAVAQETLLIYFVHLCIVYGSVWNPGLAQAFGSTRSPLQTLAAIVVLVGAMIALAWGWNRFKHLHPQWARRVSYGVAIALILMVL